MNLTALLNKHYNLKNLLENTDFIISTKQVRDTTEEEQQQTGTLASEQWRKWVNFIPSSILLLNKEETKITTWWGPIMKDTMLRGEQVQQKCK